MATGQSLPPQAYTREILTAAFNWLQAQPEPVRRAATTPDSLVALYTRAQRFGLQTLETEAPVSSQSFMSDLKNLAEGLKQFEDPRAAEAARLEMRQELRPENRPENRPEPHPAPKLDPRLDPRRVQPPGYAPPPPQQQAQYQAAHAPHSAPHPQAVHALNERSFAMLQEVRAQLNLSSDAEALNMMIALAYKSLRNLLA